MCVAVDWFRNNGMLTNPGKFQSVILGSLLLLMVLKLRDLIILFFYHIDTDEIPGFFLLLKNHIFIERSESFTCEDIGVAMVTNMISQLQESFIRILTFWNRKYKYYCLYFSFILLLLYPSFVTFLWQAFCDRWPL